MFNIACTSKKNTKKQIDNYNKVVPNENLPIRYFFSFISKSLYTFRAYTYS